MKVSVAAPSSVRSGWRGRSVVVVRGPSRGEGAGAGAAVHRNGRPGLVQAPVAVMIAVVLALVWQPR